jgi:YVTN family beta-propeller protein
VLNNASRALTAIALGGVLSLAAIPLTAVPARADTGVDVPMSSPTRDIAFSTDSSLAYVSGGNNLIKVVDTATHAIIDTIALPGTVGGIAMSPDGATLYATEGTNNNAYAINTSTRAIGAPIAVGDDPAPVVVTPNGAFAYVGNLVDKTVTVIDTSTRLVVDTIDVAPISPSKLRVAPDGSMVWALYSSSPTAVAIDTNTHATSTFDPNPNPSTVAVLDVVYAELKNEVLFVTFDGTDAAVWVYLLPSWASGGPMSGLPLGSPITAGAVDADQDILWLVSIGSATISSFPGGASAPTGAMPWSLAVRPDGLEVWVANAGGQSVTVFTRPYGDNEPNTSLPGALGDTVTIDSAVAAGTYDAVRWQYYDFGLATWQDLPDETGATLDVVLDATTESYRYRLVATSAVFGEVLSGQWAVGSPVADASGPSATLANTGADGVRTTGGIAVALVLAGLAFMGVRRSRRP